MNEEKQASGGGSPWLKILGIGCFVILLLIGGCVAMTVVGGMSAMKEVSKQMARDLAREMPKRVEDADQKAKIEAKMKQMVGFADSGNAGVKGLSTLAGIYAHKLEGDNSITPEEGQKVIEFLDILISKKGNLSFAEINDMQERFGFTQPKQNQGPR